MLTMIEDWVGVDNAPYVIWAGLGLAALLLAIVVFLLFRRSFSGTYVAGGRNRRPRLAVLDAAAIDAKRRLVLVRRDETEHLILIGGPTDVVVESGIRPGGMPAQRPAAPPQAAAQQRRPAPAQQQPQRAAPPPAVTPAHVPSAAAAPAPAPYQQPQVSYPAPPPAPPARPLPSKEVPPAAPPVRASAPERTLPGSPAPVIEPVPEAKAPEPVEAKPASSPFRRFFGSKTTPPSEASAKELIEEPKAVADDVDRSLEEEMTKLLEEISDPKK